MSSKTTSVKIMIISDTHGISSLPGQAECPKVDILLHCGDLTNRGRLHEYESTLSLLSSINADLKLVIAGNHDITLDAEYWRAHGPAIDESDYSTGTAASAMRLMKGRKALQAEVTFLHEGMHTFQLQSGAKFTVYASPYYPASGDGTWPHMAYRYESNQDGFNPLERVTKYAEAIAINPIPDFPNVDIVMTHTPPLGHLDQGEAESALFGHVHEGYGAEVVRWSGELPDYDDEGSVSGRRSLEPGCVDVSRTAKEPLQYGTETLMVNAAVMDHENQPTRTPWIVEMELPRGG